MNTPPPPMTVTCPTCGRQREISGWSKRRGTSIPCRSCAHQTQAANQRAKPKTPRAARVKPASRHISSAPELKVRISKDTSKSFEPEPDFYCGEEISPNHYCRRHFPCPHHGDAA